MCNWKHYFSKHLLILFSIDCITIPLWRELEEIQVVADTPGPGDGDVRQGRGRDVRAGRVRGGNLNRVEKYFYKALTRICF